MRHTVVQQNGHFHGAGARLLQVDAGEVGDGVGGVGTVPYVGNGCNAVMEGGHTSPIFEGLLGDHMTAVLKESSSEVQALAGLEIDVLDPGNEICNEALLLGMVAFGTF